MILHVRPLPRVGETADRSLPDDAHSSGLSNGGVARDEREVKCARGGHNQRIERIAGEAEVVGQIELFRCKVVRADTPGC